MPSKDDILDGITAKTTKEELMGRLRQAATLLRRDDRDKKKTVAEIEARLRTKGQRTSAPLQQVIVSATDAEWKESVEFLEEFNEVGLLPTPLQRMVIGGRVLMEHGNTAGNS